MDDAGGAWDPDASGSDEGEEPLGSMSLTVSVVRVCNSGVSNSIPAPDCTTRTSAAPLPSNPAPTPPSNLVGTARAYCGDGRGFWQRLEAYTRRYTRSRVHPGHERTCLPHSQPALGLGSCHVVCVPILRMEIVICLIILLVTHKFGTRPNVVAFGWVHGCITIIATRTFPLNPLIRYPVLKLVQTALPHVRRRRGT